MGASALLIAAVPAGLAVLSGAIVSDVEALLETGDARLAAVIPWLVLSALLLLVIGLGTIARRYSQERLGDEMALIVSREVLEHAASLDLAFFETKENHDILARASGYSERGYLQFVTTIFGTMSSAISFCSLLGVMFWIEPFVTFALALITVPFLIFRWRMAKVRFEVHRAKTTKRRQAKYYSSLVTQKAAVPTTKLFGLATLLMDRFSGTMRELIDGNRASTGGWPSAGRQWLSGSH